MDMGEDVVKIMERRVRFSNFVYIEELILRWVVDCIQDAINVDRKQCLVRKIRVDDRVFFVVRKENANGRYLALSAIGNNRNERFVVFPEGIDGYGLRNLASALCTFISAVVDIPASQEEKGQSSGMSILFLVLGVWRPQSNLLLFLGVDGWPLFFPAKSRVMVRTVVFKRYMKIGDVFRKNGRMRWWSPD